MPKGAEKFIQEIAREAGKAVVKRFGKDGVQYAKSEYRFDVVTKADLASEKLIISRIKEKFPTHGIIAEESGNFNEKAEYVWIIDPIDGTLNFSMSVPLFGVMVCLVRRDKVILSAINTPAIGEFFFAKASGGAYCNGKRIRCSGRHGLPKSYGAGSTSLSPIMTRFLGNLFSASKKADGMMFGGLGSMAINASYTAAGRRDWLVGLHGRIWDFAPAYLILKEAGCKVTDTQGRPWKLGMLEIVAANPTLHKQLLKLTKSI